MKNGKIALCPLAIREEVCRRLLDGQRGKEILEWLNAQPDAQRVVTERYSGKPINGANLTQWRKGGYKEWREERKNQERMTAMASGVARSEGGPAKLFDRCTAEAVSKLYSILEKLEAKPESLDEIERITKILMGLRNTELAPRKVDQRDTTLKIKQEDLALRTEVFKAKEGSVKAEAIEPDVPQTKEQCDRYWEQRAREDARLAREAWAGGKPFEEQIKDDDGLVTTIRHTVAGTEVVSQKMNGRSVKITKEDRKYWAKEVGPGRRSAAASDQPSAVSDQQVGPSQSEHVTGGGDTETLLRQGYGGQARGHGDGETAQTVIGNQLGEVASSEERGASMTDSDQQEAETVMPPSFAEASEGKAASELAALADAGQFGAGGDCLLVTGGEAILTVMSVAETRYERELDERDRRMKIKEEFRRRRLEYLGITGERLKQAL